MLSENHARIKANLLSLVAIILMLLLMLLGCGPLQQPDETTEVEPELTRKPVLLTVTPRGSDATATEEPIASDTPEVEKPQADGLTSFIEQLEEVVANQDFLAMQAMMSDPIAIGAWRSEWRQYSPGLAVEQFQNATLPSPQAVEFTGLSEDEITNLIGQPVTTMFSPDTHIVAAIHSTGWSQAGNDEAILFIAENDGAYAWYAFLYKNGRFADADQGPVPPPAGMLYSVPDQGLFQVQTDGAHQRLLDAQTASLPNLKISSDGHYAAYQTEQRQLWVIDTVTGDERQLAADYNLSNYLAWADSGSVLFTGVWLSPEEGDGPNIGHIATVDLEDATVQILDEKRLSANSPALAPDGLSVAFDVYPSSPDDMATSWLYHPDSGLQIFDPSAFTAGNTLIDEPRFNPAWSPDGRKIAWLASTGERVGLQLFDLEDQTALQLFDWDPARFGALIPSPVWSPDGQWLALEVWANNTEDNGLWLLAADGSSQIHLDDSAGSPFWYDAAQLIYWNYDEDRNGSIEIYDLTNDRTYLIDLPVNSLLVGLTDAADLSSDPTSALPFEAATFRSDPFGFEFEYPASWTVSNLGAIGSRGSATQFLDGDRIAMQMTFYLWDPKNDLAAYIDHWQAAWTASGMTWTAEEDWLLDTDHPAASFVVLGQSGDPAYFFYTTIADRYLELSGDQEIDLLATIAGTMRLFEPIASSDAAASLGCLTAVATTAESVACNVMDGIRSRNTAALPSFMADLFVLAYWRSEGVAVTPTGAINELQNAMLPADPGAYPLTFTVERGQFPSLLGVPVEDIFGPDVDIAHIIYSEGWGLDGQGAALIFIAQNEDNFYWHGLLFSPEHFDK